MASWERRKKKTNKIVFRKISELQETTAGRKTFSFSLSLSLKIKKSLTAAHNESKGSIFHKLLKEINVNVKHTRETCHSDPQKHKDWASHLR